ncbi:25221_t:CDS:2, partial [Gigaspora rosea]
MGNLQCSFNKIIEDMFKTARYDINAAKQHFNKGKRSHIEIIFKNKETLKKYVSKGLMIKERTYFGYIPTDAKKTYFSIKCRNVPLGNKDEISNSSYNAFECIGEVSSIRPLRWNAASLRTTTENEREEDYVLSDDLMTDADTTEYHPEQIEKEETDSNMQIDKVDITSPEDPIDKDFPMEPVREIKIGTPQPPDTGLVDELSILGYNSMEQGIASRAAADTISAMVTPDVNPPEDGIGKADDFILRFDESCLKNSLLAKEITKELEDKRTPDKWDLCKIKIQSIIRAFKKPKALEGRIARLNRKLTKLKESAARDKTPEMNTMKDIIKDLPQVNHEWNINLTKEISEEE